MRKVQNYMHKKLKSALHVPFYRKPQCLNKRKRSSKSSKKGNGKILAKNEGQPAA